MIVGAHLYGCFVIFCLIFCFRFIFFSLFFDFQAICLYYSTFLFFIGSFFITSSSFQARWPRLAWRLDLIYSNRIAGVHRRRCNHIHRRIFVSMTLSLSHTQTYPRTHEFVKSWKRTETKKYISHTQKCWCAWICYYLVFVSIYLYFFFSSSILMHRSNKDNLNLFLSCLFFAFDEIKLSTGWNTQEFVKWILKRQTNEKNFCLEFTHKKKKMVKNTNRNAFIVMKHIHSPKKKKNLWIRIITSSFIRVGRKLSFYNESVSWKSVNYIANQGWSSIIVGNTQNWYFKQKLNWINYKTIQMYSLETVHNWFQFYAFERRKKKVSHGERERSVRLKVQHHFIFVFGIEWFL